MLLASSAAETLRKLRPDCPASVYDRLQKEDIVTVLDLAGLDKDDLRDLGLNIGQRNEVLRWSRNFGGDSSITRFRSLDHNSACALELPDQMKHVSSDRSDDNESPPWTTAALRSMSFRKTYQRSEEEERVLDDLEEQADFWCGLVTKATPIDVAANMPEGNVDVRENVLEELFDLTSERVKLVYEEMVLNSPQKQVFLDALGESLQRCGCPKFDHATLSQLITKVSRTGSKHFDSTQFEAILSRIKLAQLLTGTCRLPVRMDTLGNQEILLRTGSLRYSHSSSLRRPLMVMTYDRLEATCTTISYRLLRDFFFGHRPPPRKPADPPLVRWIHMNGLDMTVLLALTVKYSLHPFSVEDVVEQCATKLEQYGGHYFAAVEQLSLAGPHTGDEPVRVHRAHLAIFCAGPPHMDTVITATEAEHDAKQDWPGGSVRDPPGGDDWVSRLRQRLEASHSRLREHRGDFLMYQIIDLISDEFVKVTRAYRLRLSVLESQPRSADRGSRPSWLEEIPLAQMQLTVLSRRLRGLQRLLRRVVETPGMRADLVGYVVDIKDHIDEAQEDVTFLVNKCFAMIQSCEREIEREHSYLKSLADDRLNKMVFVLTCATAIFAPVQFMAGVYGMNFQDEKGLPTIPELLLPNAYDWFWLGSVIYLAVSSLFACCCYRRFQRSLPEHALEMRSGSFDCDGTSSESSF